MLKTKPKLTKIEAEKREYLRTNKPIAYNKVIKYYDKFKRGESVACVQLQYDYTCNLHCQHCSIRSFQHKKNERFFTPSDVRELSKQVDEMGLAHVNISGGEPLVFPDIYEIIKAFEPEKYYMQCDSNGLLTTDERAKYLKNMGVDRMQVSIDSLDSKEHDEFRGKPGAYERAVKSIDSIKKAGLNIQLATVVPKHRLRTDEFIEFLEFAKNKDVPVSVIWPKPVGAWEGKFDELIDIEDRKYFEELRKKYNVYDHLASGYGIDSGCCSVKRNINITKWGDVLPCPWMYFSLGNFFKEPLKDIVDRGMKYFGGYIDRCLMSEDMNFVNNYVVKTYGRKLPVPIEDIIGRWEEDPLRQYKKEIKC